VGWGTIRAAEAKPGKKAAASSASALLPVRSPGRRHQQSRAAKRKRPPARPCPGRFRYYPERARSCGPVPPRRLSAGRVAVTDHGQKHPWPMAAGRIAWTPRLCQEGEGRGDAGWPGRTPGAQDGGMFGVGCAGAWRRTVLRQITSLQQPMLSFLVQWLLVVF
jgi:hypothetical protein